MKQGSPEWLQARAGKVTASRISDVMAKGRGSAPSATRENYLAELCAERMTGAPYQGGFVSAEMRRGTEKEPLAALAYEVSTGASLATVAIVDHPSIPMSAASPDRLCGSDGLIEIKCPNTRTHIDYLLAGVPPSDYIPQMAWQLACTGRQWCDFVSFDDRMPEPLQLFVVRYRRDSAYIADIEAKVAEFLAELDDRVSRLWQLLGRPDAPRSPR